MSKSPVVHFEMPYKDAKRVSEFYSKAFGWGMNDAGKDMGGYVLAITSETDEKGMNKVPGTINGGFYNINDSEYKNPSVVISVENIEKSLEEIKKAGGEIISKPTEIPGVGMWAVFKDSEGNRVSILQAKR